MTIQTLDAREAARFIEDGGAVLVDIREPNEHAREHIPGARLIPLSRMDTHDFAGERAHCPTVIFHCQGGNRTSANPDKLSACGFSEAYVLKGGIAGWKAAGLPTALDASKPIELQRQVQIAAGSLVLLSLILAVTVSVWFAVLAGFVGAGLVFAGASGWCGMARLLSAMPWNRAATT